METAVLKNILEQLLLDMQEPFQKFVISRTSTDDSNDLGQYMVRYIKAVNNCFISMYSVNICRS